MNRLESTTRSTMTRVEQEFQRAGQGAVQEMSRAMDQVADEAERGGQEAGRDAARGIERGLSRVHEPARRAGREAGEGAGESMGEGAESGSRRKVGGLGGKLAGLLGKAGPWLAAGTAVGGVFMVGLQSAMEKQDATAKLQAQVGAFGPRGAELGKAAGTLFSKGYGEGMGEVTDAIAAVIQNIGGMRDASKADIEAVSASAMDLANIMGEEVGGVSQAVGTMLRTGMAKNAQEAFDVLTRGVQLGANKAEDLLDTFTEYSTQFRKLGMDGKSAMGLLSQGLRAGARDADTVADALKEFSIRAVDGSKSSAEGFQALGLNAEKMTAQIAQGGKPAAAGLQTVLDKLRAMKDPVAREAAAVALFGTKAEDLGQALFSLDPSKAVKDLGQVGGAADKVGKTLHDTASQRLTQFQRTMKGKFVDFLGGQVVPGVTAFGGKANAALTRWLGDNQDVVDKARDIWAKVERFVGDGVSGAKKWLDDNRGTVQQWSQGIGDAVGTVTDIVSSGLDIANALGRIFGPTQLQIASIFFTTLIGYWSGGFKIIKGIFDVFAGILTGDWGRVWNGIKSIVSGNIQMIGSILRGAVGLLGAIWGLLWRGIQAITRGALNLLVGQIRFFIRAVISAVGWLAVLPVRVAGWFARLASAAISKGLSLVAWMRGLPRRLLSALGNMGGLLVGAGRRVIDGLISGIRSRAGNVGSAMGDIAGKIRSYLPFSPAKTGPLSGSGNPRVSGAKIGLMLADGITSSRGRVAAAMTSLTTVAGVRSVATTATGGFSVRSAATTRSTTSGAAAVPVVRVIIDLTGADAELRRRIQRMVRVEGGGNVQVAFGGR